MALVVSWNAGAVGGAFVIAESGWPEEEEGDTVNAVAVVEQVFVFWAAAERVLGCCGMLYTHHFLFESLPPCKDSPR